ncbi:sensor [Nitrospira sp. KM1]|uniref:FecR family protein n=1 Tax=Nitrospira sp. KM1 TaxID=1936990 RepID=UPI0013A74EFD|nr:FecR family protein [Nitrospira sp. KM1]BCA56589.1 sensor [Nitrospira sp. KM1]
MQSPENREYRVPSKPEQRLIREEAIGWLARLSDREATPEDRQAFEQWQSQSPTHATAYKKISHVWRDPQLDQAALEVAQAERALDHQHVSPWRQRRQIYAMAACLVVLLLGAMYFDLVTTLRADQQTAVGERRTVRLPDQSLVTLNTQTAIAMDFSGKARRVRVLKGEAFFQVQHDPNRPFIVEGGETATRAVGTEFVVRHGQGSDRVTVVEGVVEVTSHVSDSVSKERLVAGNMIESDGGRLGQVKPVDASLASAWLQGLLIVDDIPLSDVVEEIKRYYPGTIVLWNREIGARHVTGTYKLDDPSKILYHLTKTFPLRTANLADRVVILF